MILASAEFHESLDKRHVASTRLHMNRSDALVQLKSMRKGQQLLLCNIRRASGDATF